MPNITISVDSELYKRMKKQQFINWSAVARVTFRAMVEQLESQSNPKEELEKKVLKLILEIMK